MQSSPAGVVERERARLAPPTLVEMFEDRAAAEPGAVAVVESVVEGAVEGTAALTYAGLRDAASELAGRLRRAGAGRGTLVAVFAERSATTLAGYLATLMTGAAYLPLDPAYPADRIAMVLEDSGASVVLAAPRLAERLPPHTARVVLLPSSVRPPAGPPVVRKPVPPGPSGPGAREAPRPEDPAYVLYTSGSTGRPKGVVVPHRALASFLLAMRDLLASDASDVWLSVTTPSFDISCLEMYLPLVTGGRLVVAGPGLARDGAALAALIDRSGVTHVQLTPSGWRVLLDAGFSGRSRTALAGGEALAPALATELRARVGRLWNVYGPTETTVWSTAWEVPPGCGATSIGRPIANSSVQVVDDELRPVPPGAEGELLVGGDGVAHGYLGRPRLTAERFVPDPCGRPGSRRYRTGDVVRVRPDGALEFLGRSDDQVKLRGHRIELGEIEAALEDQPGVRQAAVAVRDGRLIAYVIGRADADVLARRLPAYMLPSAYVPMAAFPLTPNGKLDRRALPDPGRIPAPSGRLPRNARDRIVARLVAEVVGLPSAGMDDSFVGLGGDSISAMRLVRLAREAGLRLNPGDVLGRESLADLADSARTDEAATDETATDDAPAYSPEPGGTARPEAVLWDLTPGAGSVVVRTPAGFEHAQVAACVQALLDTHDALRLRPETAPARGGVRAGAARAAIPPPGAVSADRLLDRVDAAHLDDAGLAMLVEDRLAGERALLAPGDAGMLRAVWFDRGERRQGRLGLVAHRTAVDGASWRILLADLAAAGAAVRAGGVPRLEPVRTSFGAWSRSLAGEPAASRRTAELPFWTDTLSRDHLTLREGPSHADDSRDGGPLVVTVPSAVAEPLLGDVPAAFGTDLETILLAALALALVDWRRPDARRFDGALLIDAESGERRGLPGAPGLRRTVGRLSGRHPLRLRLRDIDMTDARSGGPAAGRAVRQVGEQRDAVPDGGLGYGLLRRLDPHAAREMAWCPESAVRFTHRGRSWRSGPGDWSLDPGHDAPGGRPVVMSGGPPPPGLAVETAAYDTPGGPLLGATWTRAEGGPPPAGLRMLAERWLHMLRAVVTCAERRGAGGLTPSDVSLVPLTQAEIDEIESEPLSF